MTQAYAKMTGLETGASIKRKKAQEKAKRHAANKAATKDLKRPDALAPRE